MPTFTISNFLPADQWHAQGNVACRGDASSNYYGDAYYARVQPASDKIYSCVKAMLSHPHEADTTPSIHLQSTFNPP